MQKELKNINLKAFASDSAQRIQNVKIQLSRDAIKKSQLKKRWPENYRSFVGRGIRIKGGTDNREAFFGRMSRRPELYAAPFTFLPIVESDTQYIREAALYAKSVVETQARMFVDTGLFVSTMRYIGYENPESNIYEIYSPLEYAGALETTATFYGRRQGILYWAAKRTKHKYPLVAINFGYYPASSEGLSHNYNYPSLIIGNRDAVNDSIVRPGSNYKKRKRRRAAQVRRQQTQEAKRLARFTEID